MFHEEIIPFLIVVKADQVLDPFPDLVLPSPSLFSPHDLSVQLDRVPCDTTSNADAHNTLLSHFIPRLQLITFLLIIHNLLFI